MGAAHTGHEKRLMQDRCPTSTGRHRCPAGGVCLSGARRGVDPEASDVNVPLEFGPEAGPSRTDSGPTSGKLCEALGRLVDLVEPRAVGNRFLLEVVVRSRERVYAT